MVINMFVPASVTIAKLFVTSFKRWCLRGRVAHQALLLVIVVVAPVVVVGPRICTPGGAH